MSTLAKFPEDTLDYGFDWSAFLATDTISTATMTATPPGLMVTSAEVDGLKVKAMISGGLQGTVYRILCTITTAAGSTANSEFSLQVRDAR